MSNETLIILMFVSVCVGILMGFPVSFTMAGVPIIFGDIGFGNTVFLIAGYQFTAVMDEFAFIAIPLFVFMGAILERSGVAEGALGALSQWLRKIRGGLGITTIIICMLLSACVGVLGASVAAIGLLTLGPLINRGYDKRLAAGIVAAGGSLSVLLPPSIVLILFSTEIDIQMVKLFLGAIAPGLLLGFCYMFYIAALAIFKSSKLPEVEKDDGRPLKYTLSQGLIAFVPLMALIFIVLGAILGGIASPTEVSAVGAVGSIIVTAAYKKCNKEILLEAAVNTLMVSTMVIFIAIGAELFKSVFFRMEGAAIIKSAIASSGLSAYGVFAVFLALVFIMGIFIDWFGISLILCPIFIPLLNGFGFDPIHVSITVLVLLQTSFLTPPFAQSVLYVMGVAPPGLTISDAYRGSIPFIIIQLLVVLLCVSFPGFIMFLPDTFVVGWN
jgi:tripartite ATP-independent transporter DctM subunit